MKHPQLTVTKRDVLGKKIKKLRREGILPGNIYGKDLASTAVQVPMSDFKTVYDEVGETGLVDVMLDGAKRPVLIKNLQMNHHEHLLLHVDFFQVNLKEKVKTMIPVVTVGEPKAVTENIGTLIQTLSEIEIEALPEELPENVEINIEHLTAVDDQVTVADLKVPEGVTILTDDGQTVVKIAELVMPEPEPEPEATAVEGEEGAAAEGETPAEGAEGESEATEDNKESSEDKKE